MTTPDLAPAELEVLAEIVRDHAGLDAVVGAFNSVADAPRTPLELAGAIRALDARGAFVPLALLQACERLEAHHATVRGLVVPAPTLIDDEWLERDALLEAFPALTPDKLERLTTIGVLRWRRDADNARLYSRASALAWRDLKAAGAARPSAPLPAPPAASTTPEEPMSDTTPASSVSTANAQANAPTPRSRRPAKGEPRRKPGAIGSLTAPNDAYVARAIAEEYLGCSRTGLDDYIYNGVLRARKEPVPPSNVPMWFVRAEDLRTLRLVLDNGQRLSPQQRAKVLAARGPAAATSPTEAAASVATPPPTPRPTAAPAAVPPTQFSLSTGLGTVAATPRPPFGAPPVAAANYVDLAKPGPIVTVPDSRENREAFVFGLLKHGMITETEAFARFAALRAGA